MRGREGGKGTYDLDGDPGPSSPRDPIFEGGCDIDAMDYLVHDLFMRWDFN